MRQRVITGIIGAVLFIGLLYIGGWPYTIFIMALAMIGLDEFAKMSGFRRSEPIVWFGYAMVVLFFVAMLRFDSALFLGQWIWLTLFIFLLATVISKNRIPITQAVSLWAAAVYITYGFYYLLITNQMEQGFAWTLFVLVTTWASDTGAYFTGIKVGKHRLWPAISPNKTIEGSLGGVAASVLIALLLAGFFLPIGYGQAALLGLVIAVSGQLGDLIQSAYKRHYGVKDSGQLFPGHGGVLDRMDSWLIVFPLLHLAGLMT